MNAKRSSLRRNKREKQIRRLKRQYRAVVDRFHLKYSYVKMLANGDFSEAQQELQYHIFQVKLV
jgi:hypothetical protein